MNTISLKDLLEAGCHFGHKVERWHPKAAVFIYGAKEGVHIIDLAKTKLALEAALGYVEDLGKMGKDMLFVGTKRQAKGVVSEAANSAGIYFLTNRWIGGFLTNHDEVKKNIEKLNRMKKESSDGSWNQFPKHERVKLEKEMRKLVRVYGGVADLSGVPSAIYIVDIKKESSAVKEAKRKNIPIIAIVDTNTDPTSVDYAIPANDDAVGSIKYITDRIASAYGEGRKMGEKDRIEKKETSFPKETPFEGGKEETNKEEIGADKTKPSDVINAIEEEKVEGVEKKPKVDRVEEVEKVEKKPKKRGRPKKKI